MERLAVGAAHSEVRAVLQSEAAIAVGKGLNPGNPVELDDRRPVNAQELCAIEPALQQVKRLPEQVHLFADVQPGIVADCLNPIDLR